MHHIAVNRSGLPPETVFTNPSKSLASQQLLAGQFRLAPLYFYPFSSYSIFEPDFSFDAPELRGLSMPPHSSFPFDTPEQALGAQEATLFQKGCFWKGVEFALLQEEHGLQPTLWIGGPYTMATMLCPIEKILHYATSTPQLLQPLFSLAAKITSTLIRTAVNNLASSLLLVISEPLADTPLLTPEMFDKLVAPGIKKIQMETQLQKIRTAYHLEGNHLPYLPTWHRILAGSKTTLMFPDDYDLPKIINHTTPDIQLVRGLPSDLSNKKFALFHEETMRITSEFNRAICYQTPEFSTEMDSLNYLKALSERPF